MYGWPVLVHHCKKCSYNTPIEYSASVWTKDHTCSHCSDSSPGADIAGKGVGEMNHAQHDELSQLFARNMHLSGQVPMTGLSQQLSPETSHNEKQLQQDSLVPVYISTHYTPTAHIRIGDSHSEPSRSPPPPYTDAILPQSLVETLRQHSIDPSALLPNQVQLFMNAEYEQRLRLLELWRIAPPSYPLEDHVRHIYHPTSVEKEEVDARARYELQMQQPRSIAAPSLQGVTTLESTPMWSAHQTSEPHWPPAARMRAASIAAGVSPGSSTKSEGAEPYILNGYQQQDTALSQSAIEPVYAASSGLWNLPDGSSGHHMENQYGMYEQIRNHADWERMNAQIMQERLGAGGDDEMMM